MTPEPYSPDALDELRRILLAPEYLATTLKPLLSEWADEHKSQLANQVAEQLGPALHDTIQAVLREELREPAPELVSALATTLGASITEVIRREMSAPRRRSAAWPRPTGEAPSQTSPDLASFEDESRPVDQETASAQAPSEKAAQNLTHEARKSVGCRRMFVLAFGLLAIVVSGLWFWQKAGFPAGSLLKRGTRADWPITAAGGKAHQIMAVGRDQLVAYAQTWDDEVEPIATSSDLAHGSGSTAEPSLSVSPLRTAIPMATAEPSSSATLLRATGSTSAAKSSIPATAARTIGSTATEPILLATSFHTAGPASTAKPIASATPTRIGAITPEQVGALATSAAELATTEPKPILPMSPAGAAMSAAFSIIRTSLSDSTESLQAAAEPVLYLVTPAAQGPAAREVQASPANPAEPATPTSQAPSSADSVLAIVEPTSSGTGATGATEKAAPEVREEQAPPTEAQADRKVIHITFDDGPNSTWTPQILDLLDQYDAQATFFVIGKEAAKHTDLLQNMVERGHTVANHTWSHRTLKGLTRDEFVSEIDQTTGVLEGGISACLRPPSGALDDDTVAYADEMGLEIVRWNIDPRDWEKPSGEEIAADVIREAQPGKIVLLHDGGGDRSQTVIALQIILETLSREGYVFEAACGG